MTLKELYTGNRTYRRFLPQKLSEDDLSYIMETVRLAHSASNRQQLRYYVVTNEQLCSQIAGIVKYAAQLPPEIGQPKEGELPAAYIVIVKPDDRSGVTDIDTGIAADVICAAAWEKGIGSCMMLNFNVTKMNEFLEVPEGMTARLSISLGYPAHTSTVTAMPQSGETKYRVDEDRNYYVPKLPVSELAIFRK